MTTATPTAPFDMAQHLAWAEELEAKADAAAHTHPEKSAIVKQAMQTMREELSRV